MLNIYYGRERQDKEKFMIDAIGRAGYSPFEPVILLVPDQYTLEAERQAFRLLGTDALVGFDVFSPSRLGESALKEAGGDPGPVLDKYGRQMILTRIFREHADEFSLYSGAARKPNLISEMNDFISGLKQYGVTADMLSSIAEEQETNDHLRQKLREIACAYGYYEQETAGKYRDSEDQADCWAEKLEASEKIEKSRLWVYGFESFAPKTFRMLSALMRRAREVNIVLTADYHCADEDLFSLTRYLIGQLQDAAAEAGCARGVTSRIDGFEAERSEAVQAIEQELFRPVPAAVSGRPDGVTIVEASDYYAEAETAAAYALHLLRDKGYRKRDITVICNDPSVRAPIAERVFEEYGIRLFLDTGRRLLDSSGAVFVLALLETVANRWRTEDLMRVLKTGLTDLTTDETEKLEEYAEKYRIRGMMWRKPFTYGEFEYGADGLSELNGIRERAAAVPESLEQIWRKKSTVREFTESFWRCLTEDLKLPERLADEAERQRQAGFPDAADETDQIFGAVVHLFDQIVGILGDDRFDGREFLDLMRTGLREAKINVLPSTVDDMMLGTTQRTRSGSVKAVIILGANEGVLPLGPSDKGLLGEDELEDLKNAGHELGRLDSVRAQEEQLALYRNVSHPSEELWVGYSLTDDAGSAARRSPLVDDLLRLFPDARIEPDILRQGAASAEKLVGGRRSTERHMVESLAAAARRGEAPDPVWTAAREWFENRGAEADFMARAVDPKLFDNRPEDLPPGLSEILFSGKGRDSVSPSRLERYAQCPFRAFVESALRPEERRKYEADSREVGDVYHDVVMNVTKQLSRDGAWDSLTEVDCRRLVERAMADEEKNYRGGLFHYSGRETYRAERIKEACVDSILALARHFNAGKIRSSLYEEPFGRGGRIDPVVFEAGGKKFYLEGRIDRLDQLENGRVKIIDYKSGNRKLDRDEAREGYSLQLMLYMAAAEKSGFPGDSGPAEPAGVFYFHIDAPQLRAGAVETEGRSEEEIAGDIRDQILSSMKLEGLLVSDPETADEVLGDEWNGRSSAVVASVQKKKDGLGGSALISDEEFEELEEQVLRKVQELIEAMNAGKIPIYPMRKPGGNGAMACRYCKSRAVCRFSTDYDGCGYHWI